MSVILILCKCCNLPLKGEIGYTSTDVTHNFPQCLNSNICINCIKFIMYAFNYTH